MGKKATLLLINYIIAAITLIVSILSILGWFAGFISPDSSSFITLISLFMLPLLVVDLLLVIYWAYHLDFFILLPLAALILNFGFISSMVQFNLHADSAPDKKIIKIATYNIHAFAQDNLIRSMQGISDALSEEGVEILCMQEFSANTTHTLKEIHDLFPDMPHRAAKMKSDGMMEVIFSKFPITDFQTVSFPQSENGAIWADIDAYNCPLKIVNVHFQTTNIGQSTAEIAQIKGESMTEIESKRAFDVLRQRIDRNAIKRSGQVEIMRNIINGSDRPILLCGDFNDTPASYAYKQMKKGFDDGFKTAGSGYASTFKPFYSLFRLDYILYPPQFDAINYYSPSLRWSDHNPVIFEFALDREY